MNYSTYSHITQVFNITNDLQSRIAALESPVNILYVKTDNQFLKDFYADKTSGENSGFDLAYPRSVDLTGVSMVDLEIACKMECNGVCVGFTLHPRNSHSAPLYLMNGGIVDRSYRGNIKVCINGPYKANIGERHFQISAANLHPIKCVLVDSLDEVRL